MTVIETPRRATGRAIPSEFSLGGANDTRQASSSTTPMRCAPVGADSRPAETPASPMVGTLGGASIAGRQNLLDAQLVRAASDEPTDRHPPHDDHGWRAVGSGAGQGQAARLPAMPRDGALLDPALALAADVLDDIERVRVANENRLRQLTRSTEDSDGETRGFGLDESHPDVARLAAIVNVLIKIEHDATLNLQRILRRHPLHTWVKVQRGVGEKQAARLLAAIGDPYIRPEIVREDGTVLPAGPRTVSALWAYAGLHVVPASGTHERSVGGTGGDPDHLVLDNLTARVGVAPKRARGTKANWSTRAKTKVYMIAESCLKQLVKPCTANGDGLTVHTEQCACSPYRRVYDDARVKYASSVHKTACPQCGPKGKSAQPGDPLSAGHQHARAMRLVMKAILRDLWIAAKEHHTTN